MELNRKSAKVQRSECYQSMQSNSYIETTPLNDSRIHNFFQRSNFFSKNRPYSRSETSPNKFKSYKIIKGMF